MTAGRPLPAQHRAARRSLWLPFVLRRLVGLAFVLFFLLLATFALIRLIPGDVAEAVAGPDATREEIDLIRKSLGVDRPFVEQFVDYVSKISRGDFGRSLITGQSITELLTQRVPPTLQLAGIALIVVMLTSVPLGLLMAHLTREGRHRMLEVLWAWLTASLGGIPPFLKAVLLIFIFAVTLSWLPVAGTTGWQSLVLPVTAITLGPVLVLARIVRLQTLDALAQDYVRTARSKRLPTLEIYLRHVMPNVLTVALTVGGLIFSGLIAGTVFVEQIFARLGMGTALIRAVLSHDYTVVQAVVLMLGITVVVVNTIVDILLALIDPRSLAGES